MKKITEQEYLSNQIDNMRQVLTHLLRTKDKASFLYTIKHDLPGRLISAVKYSKKIFFALLFIISFPFFIIFIDSYFGLDQNPTSTTYPIEYRRFSNPEPFDTQFYEFLNNNFTLLLVINIVLVLLPFIISFLNTIDRYIQTKYAYKEFLNLKSYQILPYDIMQMQKKEDYCNDTLELYFDVNLVTSDLMNTHLTGQYLEDFYCYIAEEAKNYPSTYSAQRNMNYIMLVAFLEVFIKARNLQEYRKLNQSISKLKPTTN